MAQIKTITVKGFKSIRSLETFELRALNVLIGPNGAGKSNFIGALRFLSEVAGDNFPGYVQKQGKPGALLYGGRKQTQTMEFEVFGQPNGDFSNGYLITLEATNDNRFIFTREETWVDGPLTPKGGRVYSLGRNHEEALVRSDATQVGRYVRSMMQSWRQYHFHDTSDLAAVKQAHSAKDTLRLKTDAGNLAAYLGRLRRQHLEHYKQIVETVRLVAPFFGDFVQRDEAEDTVELEWTQKVDPDTPYGAAALSDGTLRFICLATLLLQPWWLLPDTVLIDEPELGLHPYAIGVLADLLKQVSEKRQLIVSTQSVELLNALSPEDVVVVDREGDESRFQRLDSTELAGWLESYTPLGELWLRNVLGGRP
ncbi:AAA family ATPase [Variovorax sp. PAMC 28711]|uniref:AAA family ATPase n=1 Tax=Variovorax sp. PAMC 28711 TaxID=1795631 RepID=UPI00078D7278|nr:AAA family ATPase [Variovorax sp. PAMC 28711]AMM26000.1 chromosome segregation protein SMC [Variovorax sp. PAMC 28711]